MEVRKEGQEEKVRRKRTHLYRRRSAKKGIRRQPKKEKKSDATAPLSETTKEGKEGRRERTFTIYRCESTYIVGVSFEERKKDFERRKVIYATEVEKGSKRFSK